MRRLVFNLLVICSVLFLCACKTVKTSEEATTDLKSHIFADFELVNSEMGTDKSIYTFRDENGIEFIYESRLSRAFSFSTIFAKEFGFCDYARAYAACYESELNDILINSGVDYTLNTDDFEIITLNVKSRSDIKTAAQATADVIDAVGEIPTDAGITSISVPYVKINICDKQYVFENFAYVSSAVRDREETENNILNSYVNAAREGKIKPDDITDSDYKSVLPDTLPISYEDIDADDFFFSLYMDEYSADIYDLMPSKSRYSNQFSFKELCRKFGIPCTDTVTGLQWTIGESVYHSKYSNKYKEMKIYKDNAEICALPMTYMEEESYCCSVSPDELAMMLDCSYRTDNRLGRIYYNAN